MIGLGTWEAKINTMVFKGTGRVTISDVNGEYDFKFEIIGSDIPEIKVRDVVENGNILTAVGETDLLKGKEIPVTVTFDGDTFSGLVKVPMIGRVKFAGNRIA